MNKESRNLENKVKGVLSKEVIIKITPGGTVTLSVGGKLVKFLTTLTLEAVVDGEIGNINKLDATQMRKVFLSEESCQEASFLTKEEFVAAQERIAKGE